MSGIGGFLDGFGVNDELLLILLFVAIFSSCLGNGGFGGHGTCDDKLIFYIILLLLYNGCSGSTRLRHSC